ncbi:DUF4190 domain-containing protein [Cellulomonas sp. APG4]|uniref:DUF4190 domain-containing protein n=1 Tax=Cellulomonas sp. APG4 TaxID=1538656 RepID=UPI001379B853|nr:DUF4190 domain-containing protein [Cellulomonas sp. APG4]NCT91027.1 DUF4190 domain-containing protein [Cellulomonas sp. APG4]
MSENDDRRTEPEGSVPPPPPSDWAQTDASAPQPAAAQPGDEQPTEVHPTVEQPYAAPYAQPGATTEQPYAAAGAPAQQPYAQPYAQPQTDQQYAQPGAAYAQPYGGYGQPAPSKTNGLGIAALIVGILSLLICYIPFVGFVSVLGGIIAVVLGILGMRKAKDGQTGGRGMSLAGLITGAIALLVAVVINVFVIIGLNSLDSSLDDSLQELEDSGFLDETEGSVSGGDATDDTMTDDTTDPGTEDEGGVEAGALGSRENPATPGTDVITFTEDGQPTWEVTLGAANVDAWAAVQAENEFNEPPADGNVHVLLPVSATYLGTETGTPAWDLTIAFVSADGRTFDQAFGVIPDDLMNVSELYEGGSGQGNVLFEVPADALEGATWSVEAGWNSDRMFFAVVPQ